MSQAQILIVGAGLFGGIAGVLSLEDACKLGTKIEVDFEADKSPVTFDYTNVLPWLQARIEGKPLKNSC